MLKLEDIPHVIGEKGLKITPQRIAVLEALIELGNHPTAEQISEQVKMKYPNVAIGTIYKILDTLVENKIIKKVKTDRDIMRYDALVKNHHHFYCSECDLIEDYEDEELDEILKNYFAKKKFPGFKIEDIVLQIKGTFDKC